MIIIADFMLNYSNFVKIGYLSVIEFVSHHTVWWYCRTLLSNNSFCILSSLSNDKTMSHFNLYFRCWLKYSLSSEIYYLIKQNMYHAKWTIFDRVPKYFVCYLLGPNWSDWTPKFFGNQQKSHNKSQLNRCMQ
jgi:hypothetical protein